MKQIIKSILFLLIVFLVSCEKDDYSITQEIETPDPIISVQNTSLVVYVEDHQGTQPRAFISVSGQTVETDEAGRAFIKLDRVAKNGELVSIEADDRIPLQKRVLIQPGKKNILHVYLDKIFKRSGFSSTEETIFDINGVSLIIPPNALVYKDGSGPYEGDFSIWTQYYDAEEEYLDRKMPGDLLAQNEKNEMIRLKNYGMLKVNLVAWGGGLLDVKEGSKVEIHLPIPAAAAEDAPENIPTFWMNETTGLWEEEGFANKVAEGMTGYEYQFEVEHFTWWACHLYSCVTEVITVSGKLVNVDGSACGGCTVEVDSGDESISVTTSSDGSFSLLSCPDENYELIGYHQGINCNSIQGQALGTFTSGNQDTDWGEITMDGSNIITVSGTVYNCEGVTEEGSYLMVNENIFIETTEDGQFEFLACYQSGASLLLEGFNEAGTLMSDPLNVQLETQGNVGLELFSCQESDVYLNVYRDGELVQHVGRVAQDLICNEQNKVCIAVGKEYFDDEYFSAVIEFVESVDLNQVVTYNDLTATSQSSILYAEDIHNNVNNWIGVIDTIDIVEVKEYGTHKTVNLLFQAIAGPDLLELNYEIEFRIRI